jgi:hypothetical protein
MTTELHTEEDTDLDIIPEIPEELGQGEIKFEPTGVKHKDMAIAGMINDAPKACKALIMAKVWDTVCTSPNPAGKAEAELLKLFNIPEDVLKIVLIKVKNLLSGYNMSIPQAFHNCILEKVLARIDIEKLKTKVEKVQVVAVTEEPIKDFKFALNGSVLTHPDGSKYTFGTRGRRPLWVTEWLTTNPAPEA